ncbi:hypothetical protein ACQKWADRAFT_296245, partial [Trichoderma austrokoningii]
MSDCTGRDTPLDLSTFFAKSVDGDPRADVKLYQQVSGSINFLITRTRPDMAFAISMLSPFNSDPNQQHLGGIKQLLHFL